MSTVSVDDSTILEMEFEMKYSRHILNFEESSFTAVLEDLLHRQEVLIRQKQIKVVLDCDTTNMQCPSDISSTLEELLLQAIARTPQQGEIDIFVVQTNSIVEIEVADSGDNTTGYEVKHTPKGRKLIGRACPQGGMAWTVVIDHGVTLSQVA